MKIQPKATKMIDIDKEEIFPQPEDSSDKKVVIELDNVRRNFVVGDETVHALKGVSFKTYEGEFVTIMGTSGSGKSTLLNQLGCLDTPSSGEYYLDGVSVRTMKRSERAVLRNRKIGFVFQNYNLLPKTTAVENVELPLMYNSSVSASERRKRSIEALKMVGLGERLYHKSNQMSGGQMQRVAIARALVNDPAVILADEATGNLDTRTSFEILVLFQKLFKAGRTIIFVTHNPDDTHCEDKEVLISIRKAIDASPELRSKKDLIENFIAGVNESGDILNEWNGYVAEKREEDLSAIIQGERLKEDDTRRYMENAFRDGEIKTAGTDIDALLPPISRFGSGTRAKKKQSVIDKFKGFFERYFGIGSAPSFEKPKAAMPYGEKEKLSVAAERPMTYGR